MPNFSKTKKIWAISGLIVILSLSSSLIVAAQTQPAPGPLVVQYQMNADDQIAASPMQQIDVPAGSDFYYIIQTGNLNQYDLQLKIVFPADIQILDTAPAPYQNSDYVLRYNLLGASSNAVAVHAMVAKDTPAGDLIIASLIQNNPNDSYNTDLAHSFTTVSVDTNIPGMAASTTGTPNPGVPGISIDWSLFFLIALVLLAAFLFLVAYQKTSPISGTPSAVIPAGDKSGRTVVLGFSFGQRGQEPGLSNQALAEVIKNFYSDAIISVQWEIGKELEKLGIHPDHQVFKNLIKEGQYLDSEEVARQMAEFLSDQEGIGEILAIAQDDHMPRVLKTLKKYGITAEPGCANIPYDPESSQIWTRSRLLFKVRELLAWPLYVMKGVA